MRQLITTVLDAAAVVAVAAGVSAGLWPSIGPFAVAVGGGIVGVVSWWWDGGPGAVAGAWTRLRRTIARPR